MIVDKKLSLNPRKKADIVTDLKAHKFVPIPKKAKVAATSNVAEAEDEDEEDDVGESTSTSD
jgi:DNA topoisomerase II